MDNAKLQKLNDTKSKFMSMVAHDLKQPLTSIQGYVSFLADNNSEQDKPKIVNNILNAVSNMSYLINDLVDVSALSTGKFSLNMKKLVYNELMEEIYSQYKITAHEKRMNFRLIEVPVKIEITADRMRIYQVISNILNNAFKFTKEGGQIEIEYFRDGGYLMTLVRDNGEGMVNIDRSKIFGSFEQADFMSPEYHEMGWGLGMAIAYDIIAAHNGVMENDSAGPGRGSIFCFSIPFNLPENKD
jgi:signal transduction histidine kinase